MEIKAAVCRATHVPVGIESIDIDRPLGREVLVRTVATGVCHSDLHVVDGDGRFAARPPDRAGSRGRGHRRGGGRPGDRAAARRPRGGVPLRVLRELRAVPQRAPQRLRRGRRWRAANRRRRACRQKGQGIPSFAGIGSYAERMLLHENSVVKIDDDLPLDRAALVGCGVLTGVGAALRSVGDAKPGRRWPSSAAAALGCRSCRGRASAGPGRSSRSTGSTASSRWPGASARPTWSTARTTTRSQAVRALTGGAGVDHAFEAVGNTTLVRQAIEMPGRPRHRHHRRRPAARREDRVPVDGDPARSAACRPPAWAATASASTSRAISTSIARAGCCSTRWSPAAAASSDINEAFRAMKAGEVARTVLTFD